MGREEVTAPLSGTDGMQEHERFPVCLVMRVRAKEDLHHHWPRSERCLSYGKAKVRNLWGLCSTQSSSLDRRYSVAVN